MYEGIKIGDLVYSPLAIKNNCGDRIESTL